MEYINGMISCGPHMTKALLYGKKSQLRMPMDPQPVYTKGRKLPWSWGNNQWAKNHTPADPCKHCSGWTKENPIGGIGDRIHVAEDYCLVRPTPDNPNQSRIRFRADNEESPLGIGMWIPAKEMLPRMSRLALIIDNVRIQRLHNMTPKECIDEGLECEVFDQTIGFRDCLSDTWNVAWNVTIEKAAKDAFRSLWISEYSEESWDSNPWVWVYEVINAMG